MCVKLQRSPTVIVTTVEFNEMINDGLKVCLQTGIPRYQKFSTIHITLSEKSNQKQDVKFKFDNAQCDNRKNAIVESRESADEKW